MFDLGKLTFDLVSQLIWGIVQDSLKSSTLSFFERRKIERRVEDATAEVVEGIAPFLEQEKIPQEKQQRLIETCINELKPVADNPTELFKGSLDGQKIFDNLYHDKELPKVIIEDGLKDTYTLLFPRIATLLCKIPAAVKDWENEAWSESYRRFDELVTQLKSLFARVDEIASASNKSSDETLNRFKRLLSQKVGLQLDITGLRGDQPLSGKFDDFFVLPSLKQILKDEKKNPISIISSTECFSTFTNSDCQAIVIGAPGAGKSTWSKWLQRETLSADWNGIGVRVEFRSLNANELPSIYDLVRMVSGKQLAEDLSSERIRKWLNEGQISFIFDGFDEIKPSDRNIIIGWLEEISKVAMGCPFVITSRPLTTDHLEKLGADWIKWMIEPFDNERIINYISKWFNSTPLLLGSKIEIDAESLANSWFSDSTIGPLTSNPLLLSTLLMVHHLDGKLPNGRANLYKRYVDGMLGVWDDRHKLLATDIQITPEEKRIILRGIALYLFLVETETIDENAIHEWLESFLPKYNIKSPAEDVLLVLRERSGLIIGPGIYSFAHKTIAEFLVAETVLQGDQQDILGKRMDRFHLFEHRNSDRWNTVLFLWAGMAPFVDLESFISAAVKSKDYELVFGLLRDQYDRFSLETRRKLLLKLKTLTKIKWRKSHWVLLFNENLPEDEEASIPVPYFFLRSPSGDTGFSRERMTTGLVERAVLDGALMWDDFKNAKGNVYDMMWAIFAVYSLEPITWEKVLNSPPPSSSSKIKCAKVVAHWVFNYQNDGLIELIEIYKKIFPEFTGYIPIALVSNLVQPIIRGIDKADGILLNKYIENTIEVIEQVDVSLVLPFARQTKSWSLMWAASDNEIDFPRQGLIDLALYAIDVLASPKYGILGKADRRANQLIAYLNQINAEISVDKAQKKTVKKKIEKGKMTKKRKMK
jgi:hypothetical protein